MYLITTLSPFVCLGYVSSVKWPQITRLWKNVTKWTVFSGGSRPSDKGGARSQKQFFSALRASVWSKNKGEAGPAGPSPGSATGCNIRDFNAPCKRTQHCWPTTPNVVGCYMLRLFAHPVACCCVLLPKVWNRPNFSVHSSQHFFCSVIAEA